jgi:prepilin-type processing-associated H-X9-DG protein
MMQNGLAFLQYAQDYDERWPNGTVISYNNCSFGGGGKVGSGWASQIMPYLKSTQVLVCPNRKRMNISSGKLPLTYGYNNNIADPTKGSDNTAAALMSQFNAAARTVVLSEVVRNDDTNANYATEFDPDADCSSMFINGRYSGGSSDMVKFKAGGYHKGDPDTGNYYYVPSDGRGFHFDGSNYLAADGHVKWLKSDQVSAGWNNTSSTNNAGNISGNNRADGTESPNMQTLQLTFSLR